MALSKEDHHDVSKAMGKALANKVRTATKDLPRMRNLKVKSQTPHKFYLSRDKQHGVNKLGGNASY